MESGHMLPLELVDEANQMGLSNSKLKKVNSTTLNGAGISNYGFAQSVLVQPAVALPDPGPRDLKDPTWPQRFAEYLRSVQTEQKYGQDSE
jgi:hypothetical protein